ncbi:hypothetical protein D3C87_1626280 [compost metagenome]
MSCGESDCRGIVFTMLPERGSRTVTLWFKALTTKRWEAAGPRCKSEAQPDRPDAKGMRVARERAMAVTWRMSSLLAS